MSAAGATPAPAAAPTSAQALILRRFAPWLIALVCVLVYANSLGGVFLYDDQRWIVENEDLHVLWPPWTAMGLSFRQLAFYSFAVNHAISGHDVWSYHAVNLALHVLTALTLLGLTWRTLRLPRLGETESSARALALVVATIWAVHPLNTQAVVYVIQRAEVLVGLAYLLTLYCFVRATESTAPRARRLWHVATVGAFLLGLASKEVIATAPLALYLFDAVVVSGSFSAPWRRRWPLYTILIAPFVLAPLAWLVVDPERFVLLKVDQNSPSRDVYLFSQGAVLVEYLRLAVWPAGQNLDHAWRPENHRALLTPAFALMAVLFIGIVEAVRRRSALGWLGLMFFLALAPSSSLFPLADYLVEHRMYLALIPCAVIFALSGRWVLERLLTRRRSRAIATAVLVGLVVTSLGVATHARNRAYGSRTQMWSDVVSKAPHNARAHFNLGLAFAEEDETVNEERVLRCFRRTVELDRTHRKAHHNLGVILLRRGEHHDAAGHLRTALAIGNKHPFEFHLNYARSLMLLERHAEAAVVYRQALGQLERDRERKRDRGNSAHEPGLRADLGICYAETGEGQRAVAEFQRAIELDPALEAAHANLVSALLAENRLDEAAVCAEAACEAHPGSFEARATLARVLAAQGRTADAVRVYLAAARLRPEAIDVRLGLMQLCADSKTRDAAEQALFEATKDDPDDALAREQLETIRQLR